jgi:hypothetical protein
MKMPRSVDEHGIRPTIVSSDSSIRVSRLNPIEIYSGISGEKNTFPDIVSAFVSIFISKTTPPKAIEQVTLRHRGPILDQSTVWNRLKGAREIESRRR